MVYLSNEDPTYTEVYFDDLTITLNEHPVIQMDDYYPFGLTHYNGYQRVSAKENRFKYNGKEEITELGLDWYDYGARMYMPDLGRWSSIDPLADQFFDWSPYVYALNNPVNLIDPDGRAAVDPKKRLQNISKAVNQNINNAWNKSFNVNKKGKVKSTTEQGFAVVQNSEGKISSKNEKPGSKIGIDFDYSRDQSEELIGDVHTHSYKDGSEGVAFSSGDIADLGDVIKEEGIGNGFARIVEAGDSRFGLVITDIDKAKDFLSNAHIQENWNAAYESSEGTFQERVIAANKAVLGDGSESGIEFYKSTNAEKDEFEKVE